MPRSQAQSILSTASLFRTCAPRDLSWIRIHFLSGGVSRPTVWTEIRSHSAQIPLRSDPTPLRSHSAQISLRSDPTPLRSHSAQIPLRSDPTWCASLRNPSIRVSAPLAFFWQVSAAAGSADPRICSTSRSSALVATSTCRLEWTSCGMRGTLRCGMQDGAHVSVSAKAAVSKYLQVSVSVKEAVSKDSCTSQ